MRRNSRSSTSSTSTPAIERRTAVEIDNSLGDRLALTTWGAVNLREGLSASLRLSVETWGDVTGADTALNPRLVPTADPDLRGGSQADFGLGVNIYATGSTLTGHRLAMEWSIPVYRDVNGPQLERDWRLTVGWQKAVDTR